MAFDQAYYDRYKKKSLLGGVSGERAYLYNYWVRFFKAKLGAKSHAKILDIGCGLGFFSKRLSQHFDVLGMDISEAAIAEARKLAPQARFETSTSEKFRFESESFDAVVAFDVLEHIEQPEVMLREIQRVLKKGGVLVASMPNVQSVGLKLRKDKWYAYSDPTHVSLLPREEWLSKLQASGFSVDRVGSDFLWDIPYVSGVPALVQRLVLVSLQWGLVWSLGIIPWKYGETLFIVAEKK